MIQILIIYFATKISDNVKNVITMKKLPNLFLALCAFLALCTFFGVMYIFKVVVLTRE